MTPQQRQKVAAARLWAAAKYPYLASALFAAEVILDERVPGVASDRNWRLYVHPHVVDAWTAAQLGAVLVHHCGHLLRDHAARAEHHAVDETRLDQWITAADCETNDDLTPDDIDLPERPIQPSDIGCAPGRLAEEYYATLEAHPERTPRPDD